MKPRPWSRGLYTTCPLTTGLTASPVTISFSHSATALGPPCASLSKSSSLLPPGLCSYYSFCLDKSSPGCSQTRADYGREARTQRRVSGSSGGLIVRSDLVMQTPDKVDFGLESIFPEPQRAEELQLAAWIS